MWRLRQAKYSKPILTTQRIETCSRETAYTYERKITAILTIKYNKLKPLPENPRIERHGDFSFKEKFLIFIVYEETVNNITDTLHYHHLFTVCVEPIIYNGTTRSISTRERGNSELYIR